MARGRGGVALNIIATVQRAAAHVMGRLMHIACCAVLMHDACCALLFMHSDIFLLASIYIVVSKHVDSLSLSTQSRGLRLVPASAFPTFARWSPRGVLAKGTHTSLLPPLL